MWHSKLENANFDLFPTLKQFIDSSNILIITHVKIVY
jgi:hypothetical protein